MIKKYEKKRTTLADKFHKGCIFNRLIKMKTKFNDDGSLTGYFFCDDFFQGYSKIVHGGILSGLIDSAMTQCLFGNGIVALTGRLNIRYIKPVNLNNEICIKIKIDNIISNKYYYLNGIIYQDNKKRTSADAVFVNKFKNS